MGIDEGVNRLGRKVDELLYAFNKAHLKSLKNEEENLRRLELSCIQKCDWAMYKHYSNQLGHVLMQEHKIYRNVLLYEKKKRFQQRLQKKHIDSLVIVHEYDPYTSPPRIKVEIIPKHKEEQTSLAPPHVDIQESNGENACEIQESEDDVVVDAPCNEMVEALEEVVEIPCIEGIKEIEEGVDTTCIEKEVGLNKECVGVVDEDTRLEVGLLVEQTGEHEYVKVDFVLEKLPTLEHGHLSRVVEFKPTKIRGRIFTKNGKVQQVSWNGGNTSKLINLVSLFNIWIWLIMQVKTKAFFITWVMIIENLVPNLIEVY